MTESTRTWVVPLRRALAEMTPASSQDATVPPALGQIYTPAGHEATLDPERPLVVGSRGVGKSFWSAVLLDSEARAHIATRYPRLALNRCQVALGFAGVDTDTLHLAPSREMLDELIGRDGHPPERVWRAVIQGVVTRQLVGEMPARLAGPEGLAAWVAADVERAQLALREADEQLFRDGRRLMIVFDALDRVGERWPDVRARIQALLRVALAMRPYRAIKLKIFLRADQADDRAIVAFADASKLLGARVDLLWERADLYGLLFTLLLKEPDAAADVARLIHDATGIDMAGAVDLPPELMGAEAKQEVLFTALEGRYMGNDARRGKTYTWLYNHLADAFGRVSPRTFLEALRQAARYPHPDPAMVLHPRGLQAGIQGASELRLHQLKDDYGWIEPVLEPLADLNVPCAESALMERWEQAATLHAIGADVSAETVLAMRQPVELADAPTDQRHAALLKALMRLGVAERRADNRINVPDIYRVAAKLLRRGGVKPR